MTIGGIVFPYWDDDDGEYHVSMDEKVGDASVVRGGQGIGMAGICGWLDGEMRILGKGAERMVREDVEKCADTTPREEVVHFGEGYVVLYLNGLFLILFRYDNRIVVLLKKEQFLSVLDGYGEFTRMSVTKKHRPPLPFEVEYEAEGEEAIRIFQQAGGCVSKFMEGGDDS